MPEITIYPDYDYDGTSTDNVNNFFTLEDIQKVRDTVSQGGIRLIYPFFHPFVPEDRVFHGRTVDSIVKQLVPGFNLKFQKAYLLNPKWKD